ncbi:MAG: GH116 family glycosyl hydrolase, partial [Armatimonadota bacterium]
STEDNTPVVLSMSCEAGKVVLVMGALMGSGASALAERRQALKLLAAAARTKYAAGVGVQPTDPTFGDMAIATDAKDASVMLRFESAQQLVTILGKSRSLPSAQHNESTQASPEGEAVKGALSASVSLPPGGESTIRFYLTWRFRNYTYQGHNLGNHYAKRWDTAYAVASEVHKSRAELLSTTELYRKTMYETTLPYWLVDCLTSQSSTIRSEVCIWTDEDAFAGFEGAGGCCPMNCSHVWGYEQTLARLYPDLEQRMRNADFKHQQNPDGGLNNRIILPLQNQPSGERPFIDGHASGILKAYREHLNSPDNAFLKNYYPNIKLAVEYLVKLDGEKPDGIIEGKQWNTYDCQVSGANSFIGAYYLAALRAGEEMATLMGDAASAKRWRSIFESGRNKLVDLCWNGEYFVQNLPGYEKMATQYGPGCLADQLIGQWWAHQLGLGYVLPPELVKKALQSVFNFNWRTDFTDFKHNQRVFADGHDKGLLCCTWPKGGQPPQPIRYRDEVWTGIEYQVAAHMIYEGMEREGLAIVAGARERYDGQKRNPWNEIECGGHYARAMSNWSLLLAVSGFQYDGPKGILGFAPTFSPEKYKAPFTTAEGWGSYAQVIEGDLLVANLFLAHGTLALNELRVAIPRGKRVKSGSASVSGKAVGNVSGQGAFAVLSAKSLSLLEGQTLSVQLQLG